MNPQDTNTQISQQIPVNGVTTGENSSSLAEVKVYKNAIGNGSRILFIFCNVVMGLLVPGSLVGGIGLFIFSAITLLPCIIVISLFLRRKMTVSPKGIDIHYALHSIHINWSDISKIDYDISDTVKAPYIYLTDNKKYKLAFAFKKRSYMELGLANIVVDANDPFNTAIMTDLRGRLENHGTNLQ